MTQIDIPDFDDMLTLVGKIKTLNSKKLLLDTEIKFEESKVVKVVTIDPVYFQSGKPPSMSFIDTTFKYTGLNGELIPKRKELAVTIAELEEARLIFEIMKMKIEVYRTESANQRTVTL